MEEPETWQIVERESTDVEFIIPDGFVFVEINEDNFRNYMSRIQHLLTEEVGEKLPQGLVGFVKSAPEQDTMNSLHPPIYKIITRDSIDEEFDVPPGFELIPNRLLHADEALAIEEITEEGDSEKLDQGLAALVKFSMMSIDSDDKQDNIEDVVPGDCVDTEFQCCSDLVHPQHGYQGYGCCAASKFGCCPDNVTPAPGPFFEVSTKITGSLISPLSTLQSNFRVAIAAQQSLAVVQMISVQPVVLTMLDVDVSTQNTAVVLIS